VANGDSMIKTKSALIDDSECEPHSIVNMSELLASSAAAYAHKPSLSAQCQSNGQPSSSTQYQSDMNHSSIMNKVPVVMNGTKKKAKSALNGGVPLFNHKNARDWIQRRANYDKND